MRSNDDFDISKFDRQVIWEFNVLRRRTQNTRSADGDADARENALADHGLVRRNILSLLYRLSKAFERGSLRTPAFVVKEQRAQEILDLPAIRSFLCRGLRQIMRKDLSPEETTAQTVTVVTSLLTDGRIIRKLNIERDREMFGILTFKISETGISGYCTDRAEKIPGSDNA